MPDVDPSTLIGLPSAAADGQPLGRVEEVFIGRASGEPEFVVVPAGRESGRLAVVPLRRARIEADRVVLSYACEAIATAPTIQLGVEELTPDDEARVLAHFAAGTPAQAAGSAEAEVVRSEEQLQVGTVRVPTERVRVRKVIVTEPVTITVDVRREELRVEREPLSGAEPAVPDDGGGQLVEDDVELVLLAEEPVVEKRVVAVERVRISKDARTEERRVDEELRRERVDVEGAP